MSLFIHITSAYSRKGKHSCKYLLRNHEIQVYVVFWAILKE
jgi:hypothetical protein